MIYFDGIIYSWHAHGGIAVYFNEIIHFLIKNNVEFKRFYFNEVEANINDEVIDCRYFERYRKFSRKLTDGIFHSTYYRIPENKKIPIITTVHDFIYEKSLKGPRQWLHSWQKFKAIRASDYIICVSNNTRNDFFEFFPNFPKERVHVIFNGVSPIFKPLNSFVSPKVPYALFVGGRGLYKNFIAAVYAVQIIPELNLYFIGGGNVTAEENNILERVLPGRYKNFGFVTVEKQNELYSNAYCLLYPSEYEGFGIPIVEAMRSGCPVVALNRSSIPEVSGEHGLLLADADPATIANALQKLSDESIRKKMIDGGLSWSLQFSWERCGVETLQIYKKMLIK